MTTNVNYVSPFWHVITAIVAEREAQDEKWGEQNHPNGTGGPGMAAEAEAARLECQRQFAEKTGTWMDILDEEVAEAYAESDPVKLRAELIQVGAVVVAWIEAIDRATAPPVLWRTHHGAQYSNVQAIPCSVIANGELVDANGDPIQEAEPAIAAEIARRGGTYRDHGYGVRLPGVIGLTPTVGCDHSS